MKVRYSVLVRRLIQLFIVMHLCYFFILFGRTSLYATAGINKPRMMILYLLIALSVAVGMKYKGASSYFRLELVALILIWVRAFIGAVITGVSFDDFLVLVRPYTYPILAIPIIKLLVNKHWDFNKMLKYLVVITSIDTILRGINSVYEMVSGTLLWSNLVSGSLGYRNNIVRINPCGLDILVIPIAFYLYKKSKSFRSRVTWIGAIAINLLYTLFVWQARSAIMYKIAVLLVLYLGERVSDRKKLARIIILVAVCCFVINAGVVDFLTNMFSTSYTVYGGSNTARVYALTYFMNMYKSNFLFGTGLLSTENRYAAAIGRGMLEDLGFLYGCVQLGVFMIVYYLLVLGRGFTVYRNIKSENQEMAQLVLSLTLIIILFGINIDTFYMFAIALPFYISICEFAQIGSVC